MGGPNKWMTYSIFTIWNFNIVDEILVYSSACSQRPRNKNVMVLGSCIYGSLSNNLKKLNEFGREKFGFSFSTTCTNIILEYNSHSTKFRQMVC